MPNIAIDDCSGRAFNGITQSIYNNEWDLHSTTDKNGWEDWLVGPVHRSRERAATSWIKTQDDLQCRETARPAGGCRRRINESLRYEFAGLVNEWRDDTRYGAHIAKKTSHPAYLRIIGLGYAVVPLLLEELRDRPDHWFVALRATANASPDSMATNPATARELWLHWGRTEGMID